MFSTNLMDEIKKALNFPEGKWIEKKGVWEYSAIIAERKTFLAKRKLTYSAKLKIDKKAKKSNSQKCSLKQDPAFPVVVISIMV